LQQNTIQINETSVNKIALKYILVCLSVHLTVHFNPISIKDK